MKVMEVQVATFKEELATEKFTTKTLHSMIFSQADTVAETKLSNKDLKERLVTVKQEKDEEISKLTSELQKASTKQAEMQKAHDETIKLKDSVILEMKTKYTVGIADQAFYSAMEQKYLKAKKEEKEKQEKKAKKQNKKIKF